jgi:anti-sigma regulatory factor (Ser/Thr protein kinase)
MRLRFSLDLPEDFSHLGMVRRVSRDVLASYRVTQQDIDDIEVLIGELSTNAVRHARGGEFYRIEVELADDVASVTVTDHGAGFVRSDVAPPGELRPDDFEGAQRIGGLGLPLVESLADTVQFLPNQPHGTVVRAEKRLRHADALGSGGSS